MIELGNPLIFTFSQGGRYERQAVRDCRHCRLRGHDGPRFYLPRGPSRFRVRGDAGGLAAGCRDDEIDAHRVYFLPAVGLSFLLYFHSRPRGQGSHCWFLFGLVQMVILGILVALIYEPLEETE